MLTFDCGSRYDGESKIEVWLGPSVVCNVIHFEFGKNAVQRLEIRHPNQDDVWNLLWIGARQSGKMKNSVIGLHDLVF